MDPVRIGPSLAPTMESDVSAAPAEIKPAACVAPSAASTPASSTEGTMFRPSVGDEVLIAFEHGDPRMPYLTGALWNAGTPPTSASPSKENGASAPSMHGVVDPATGHKDTPWLDEQVKLIGRHLKP